MKGGETMPTLQKARTIDELADQLSRAKLAILTDYRGLKVSDLQGLRGTLRPMGAEFRIAKNTLTKIAADRVGISGLDPVLEGPLALALVYDDIVGASKVLTDFARTSRILTVKGGVIDNRFISAGDVETLATMPPREVLLGRLVGMLASPMARTVGVLSGPSRSIAYLLKAREEQMAGGEAIAAD
ncbi:MAG: large subunit ribosomal protein [Thermomicrobiales bacterium]|jgi:large subunit ribosomal protein L10|nr:large subunit ribosomal protein [Thermomicrobiales bacterium]MEA2586449.1 large subunit ribosomal protein [Thermomicrobiales bacterium]